MGAAKEKMYSKEEKAVIGALRTTYWLAREEIASSKFSSLSSLLALQGAEYVEQLNREDPMHKGQKLSYQSSNAVADHQVALSSVVEEDVLSIVERSLAIGLMTDESTDTTVSRKLMVYAKAIHPETKAL